MPKGHPAAGGVAEPRILQSKLVFVFFPSCLRFLLKPEAVFREFIHVALNSK